MGVREVTKNLLTTKSIRQFCERFFLTLVWGRSKSRILKSKKSTTQTDQWYIQQSTNRLYNWIGSLCGRNSRTNTAQDILSCHLYQELLSLDFLTARQIYEAILFSKFLWYFIVPLDQFTWWKFLNLDPTLTQSTGTVNRSEGSVENTLINQQVT